MEHVKKGPAHQAYILLRIVFVIAPIVAGLDKFFGVFTKWDQYLMPLFGDYGHAFMLVVGVIEIVAGLGVLFKPKLFSNIVALWFLLIIVNLLILGNYYDIALRDFGLMLSALALGRLAKAYS